MNVCLYVQSRNLLAYVVMCMHALQVVVLLCTVCRTVIQSLYFKPDLQEDNFTELLAMQHKLLTNEDLMELETQRKDGERERKK